MVSIRGAQFIGQWVQNKLNGKHVLELLNESEDEESEESNED